MHQVPVSCFSVKLLNMLILSSKVQQIIKYVESGFTCKSDVFVLFGSMLKQILDPGSNYGSTGKKSDACGSKALFIISRMSHENIILN